MPDREVIARLRDVRLVVLDIDGTIRSRDDPGCMRVDGALRRLDEAGMPWTFATGRPYRSMVQVTQGLFREGRRRLVSCNYNGGVVHDPGVPPSLAISRMRPDAIRASLDAAAKSGMAAVVFSCRGVGGRPVEAVRHGSRPTTGHDGIRSTGEALRVGDGAPGHDDVVAVVLETDRTPATDTVAVLQAMVGSAAFVSTAGGPYFDLSPPGVSKGAALPALAARMGVRLDQVMAIGDGLNDVEMLSAAGVGVAVANAPDAVKAAADVVVKGRVHDGVGQAVAMLLAARSSTR